MSATKMKESEEDNYGFIIWTPDGKGPLFTPIPDGSSPPSHSSLIAFQCSLPSQLHVPVIPPNHVDDSANVVSSVRSNIMHILSDNVSLLYHHIQAHKPSLPIPACTKTQIPLDTKHTSPKKTPPLPHVPCSSTTLPICLE